MFNFFNKGNKVSKVSEGSHGDHWGAYVGFKTFSEDKDRVFSIINTTTEESQKTSKQNGYTHITSQEEKPGCIVVLNSQDKISLAYPFLKTDDALSCSVSEIIEWSHVNNEEAQITVGVNQIFTVTFFASDYILQTEKYKKLKDISVAFGGFAYVVDRMDTLPEQYSQNFTALLPSKHAKDDYDFIGKVLDVEKHSDGYLLKVGMINPEDDQNFLFNPTVFVHKENMRVESVKKGDRITGTFWLQGYIVE